MREMKDSGIGWIGEIPQNWNLSRLQYSLEEINEKNEPIRSKQVLSLVKDVGVMLYEEKGDIGNKAKANLNEYKLAYPNSLVVNSMNILIGSVGISNYFGCVSPVYYVFKETDFADIRFINYIFNTKEFQKELRKYANGILEIRLRVSIYDIFKRKIALPDKNEQQQIADFLDRQCSEIDATAEGIQKEISLLEDYKKSVISEAVTQGLNPHAEMKDSGIEWIGQIPKHWNVIRIGYILSEIDRRSITGMEESLSVSQVLGVVPSSQIAVPSTASTMVGQKIVESGELVLNKLKAHLGVCFVSNYNGLVSPDYAVYKANEKVKSKLLEYVFHTASCIWEFKKYITGVGQGLSRLYTKDLFRINIALPDMLEQQQIVDYLDSKCAEIDALIVDKKRQLDILADYKKSLIYEYVTGKKEVPVHE